MTSIALNSLLRSVVVGDVMAPGMITCPPRTPLTDVAALMSGHQVHAVVVDPVSPRLITAHDVVRAILAGAHGVEEAAAASPLWATPEESLQAVAERMAAAPAAHVLVRDHHDGPARGIVSSFDVASVLAGHEPRTARLVRPAPARPAIGSGRLDRHTVREIMHRGVIQCRAQAQLTEVASAMVERRSHTVMVSDETGWSFLSDMDLVGATARGDLERSGSQLSERRPAALVGLDETVETAARAIAAGVLGHVVAIDGDGHPVGVVSTLDIVGVIAAG